MHGYIAIPVYSGFEKQRKKYEKENAATFVFLNKKTFAPKTAPMEPRGNSDRASAVAADPLILRRDMESKIGFTSGSTAHF